jgi:heme exporter protein A
MLEVEGLACQRGGRWLFRDLDFTLVAGELLHVQGVNGSGKTSLLRILAGLSLPERGRVLWQNGVVEDAREEYVAELLYLGHQPAVKDDLTVIENLMITCRLAGVDVSLSGLVRALETVGLARCMHAPARILSQGQRRRLALARLWLDARPLWILDEPFTALDMEAAALLENRLQSHLARGGMIVLTTHQRPVMTIQCLRMVSLGT